MHIKVDKGPQRQFDFKWKALALSALLIGFSINSLSASTIYANSSSGNDANNGLSPANAKKTFHGAYLTASAGDIIDLTGTFTWTDTDETGDLVDRGYPIDKNLVIQGQGVGNTIVQAHGSPGSADRKVFEVGANATNIEFRNLTIQHGGARCWYYSGDDYYGGAIGYKYGVSGSNYMLIVRNCELTANYARSSVCFVSAVALYSTGSLILENSTIHNNVANRDEVRFVRVGIPNSNAGSRIIRNCTFTNNTTTVSNSTKVWDLEVTLSTATIEHCTFTQSTRGLYCQNASSSSIGGTEVNNCILYGSLEGADLSNVANSTRQPITVRNSIVENYDATSSIVLVNTTTGTQNNLNLSSTLAQNSSNNGTRTLALSSGSVAIDAADPNYSNSPNNTDQRGFFPNGTRDIGAFEFNGFATPCDANVAVLPSGGGTQANPYLIANFSNLRWISENSSSWGAYFTQTANIDAAVTSESCYNSGAGWSPIGNTSTKFTGTYNGGNFAIQNLYINRTASDYQGLFGWGIDCSVSDLSLTGLNINSRHSSGGMMGRLGDNNNTTIATITNVSVAGTVNGNNSSVIDARVGGLIGLSQNAVVDNCTSSVAVAASSRSGGLIGELTTETPGTGGIVKNCSNSGTVNSVGQRVGGLIGYANLNSTIRNSSNSGNISAQASVGGLIGFALTSTINSSYSTGTVTAADDDNDGTGFADAGGLAGDAYSGCSIDSCYATGAVIASGRNVGGLVGYTTSNTTINRSYASGNVAITSSTQGEVGGLLGGVAGGATGSVSNSYATGSVSAASTGGTGRGVGGLIGRVRNTITSFTVNNCYSTGTVTATADGGGLIGLAASSVVNNSYWNSATTGQASSQGGGTALNTAQMQEVSSYVDNWDFSLASNIWGYNPNENSAYPFLRWQGTSPAQIWLRQTDADWSTGTNWSENSVPTNSSIVVVPNQAKIDKLVISSAASAASVFLESGAQLEVNQGHSLAISNDLDNNGSLSLLATGGGSPAYAQMKFSGSYSGSGTVHQEQNFRGGWQMVATSMNATSASHFGNVGSNAINGTTNTQNLFYWNGSDYVNVPDNSASITPGRGYFGYVGTYGFRDNAGVQRFSGSPNTSASPSLSNNQAAGSITILGGQGNQGWNLIANPFTCALDFGSITARTNVGNAFYVYDNNKSGGAGYIAYSGAGIVNPEIAPLQSFWVKANAASPSMGSMNMANHGTLARSPQHYKTNSKNFDRLVLRSSAVADSAANDYTVVAFIAGSTDGFDNEWDAHKLANGGDNPNLYSLSQVTAMATNAIDFGPTNTEAKTVDLGFQAPQQAAVYEISFDDSYMLHQYSVFLEDKKNQHFHDLRQGAYRFGQDSNWVQRFVLHLQSQSVGKPAFTPQTESLEAWVYQRQLHVLSNYAFKGQVELRSLGGQIVYRSAISAEAGAPLRRTLPAELASGVYLLSLREQARSHNFKVYLD